MVEKIAGILKGYLSWLFQVFPGDKVIFSLRVVFVVSAIMADFPSARWIQASAGVYHDLRPQVGGALSLTPGDDQDGRWGDILSPGSLGFGFGFVSGDTKPYIFWHHRH